MDNSVKDFRKEAEELWTILDTIDTIGGVAAINDLETLSAYINTINRLAGKRRKYFISADSKLLTPEEYKEHRDKLTQQFLGNFKMMNND